MQTQSHLPETDYMLVIASQAGYGVLFTDANLVPEGWLLQQGVKYVAFLHDLSLWDSMDSLCYAAGSDQSFRHALAIALEVAGLLPQNLGKRGYFYVAPRIKEAIQVSS